MGLEQDLTGDALSKEVCSAVSSAECSTRSTPSPSPMVSTTLSPPDLDLVGKDHTNFLLVIAGYLTTLCCIFIIFFTTKFKRTIANQIIEDTEQAEDDNTETNGTKTKL